MRPRRRGRAASLSHCVLPSTPQTCDPAYRDRWQTLGPVWAFSRVMACRRLRLRATARLHKCSTSLCRRRFAPVTGTGLDSCAPSRRRGEHWSKRRTHESGPAERIQRQRISRVTRRLQFPLGRAGTRRLVLGLAHSPATLRACGQCAVAMGAVSALDARASWSLFAT